MLLRCNYGLTNGRMLSQCEFNLAQFNSIAAEFHLAIEAADELEPARRAIAHEVAGAIHPRAGYCRERIGHELRVGQVGTLEVAARDAVATDVKFASDAERHGLAGLIEDVELRVGDWAADRDGVGALDARDGGPDGGFGGSVHVPELARAIEQTLRRDRVEALRRRTAS